MLCLSPEKINLKKLPNKINKFTSGLILRKVCIRVDLEVIPNNLDVVQE